MAYSDFTLAKLRQRVGINYIRVNFSAGWLPNVPPSAMLTDQLATNKTFPLLTEKAKSEFLIAPILQELYRNNRDKITIFSGFSLDVSELLNGYCDYIVSHEPGRLEVTAPVFCVVEAKNRTLEEGLGQCGAEMYAAWQFNEAAGQPTGYVYGAVTDGYEWIFLHYAGTTLDIDTTRFYIEDLPALLGALQTIVDAEPESART